MYIAVGKLRIQQLCLKFVSVIPMLVNYRYCWLLYCLCKVKVKSGIYLELQMDSQKDGVVK